MVMFSVPLEAWPNRIDRTTSIALNGLDQCSLQCAQMRSTIRSFAQVNLILAHLQLSKTLEKHENKRIYLN